MSTKFFNNVQALVWVAVILSLLVIPLAAKDVFRGRMLTERAPIEPPAVEIQIEIESWTTPEEIVQFNQILASSGPDAFLSAFNATNKGVVRFLMPVVLI